MNFSTVNKILGCFILLFMAYSNSLACPLAPMVIHLNSKSAENYDIEITETPIDLCENCSLIEVIAPESYESFVLTRVVFTSFADDLLVSSWVNNRTKKREYHELGAILLMRKPYKHSFRIKYGRRGSRCDRYEFEIVIE